MNTLPVTVLIATRNEAANLPRCLTTLRPAAEVYIIDSGSTDGTPQIAREHGARVVQFTHRGGYPKKRQWAMNQIPIVTPWVLLIDADESVPESLWSEIGRAITRPSGPAAYLIRKQFHFLGRRFRFGGFSHAAVVLFKTGRARFEELIDCPQCGCDMEVHERLIVDGRIGQLHTALVHEDFKGLHAYLQRHNAYSTWEAALRHQYLHGDGYGTLIVRPRLLGNSQERRRFIKRIVVRLPMEHWWWFGYHYVLRLGCLEGRRGLIACQIRAAYIAQVRAKMFALRMRARQTASHDATAAQAPVASPASDSVTTLVP
jgi:glycosyltransferase involved in cell wall biosynthesis